MHGNTYANMRSQVLTNANKKRMQELQRQQSLARRLGANPEADPPKKFVIEVLALFILSRRTPCVFQTMSEFRLKRCSVHIAQQQQYEPCSTLSEYAHAQFEVDGSPLCVGQVSTNLQASCEFLKGCEIRPLAMSSLLSRELAPGKRIRLFDS